MMQRRELMQWAAAAALAGTASQLQAQAGGLRILIGFAPGGSTDLLARHLADAMKDILGRPVIVENRTGASGRLAVEAVRQAADGDTLLLAPHGAMTLFPHIYKSLTYDPARDFTPLTRVSVSDYALAVSAAAQPQTLASFKTWAASLGQPVAFGSPGTGTVLHFLGMQIGRGLGIQMSHIPYRGAAPALTDLIGGAVQAVVTPLADLVPLQNAGRIRVLATTGASRTTQLDGVPTMKEAGIDLDVTAWTGLYASAAAPADARDRLAAAAVQALRSPAVQARLAAMGMTAAPSSPPELVALQTSESAVWARAVQASGFTPQD
jgi:tripartite-type tricarboxylate transporter receptor subunit TctC